MKNVTKKKTRYSTRDIKRIADNVANVKTDELPKDVYEAVQDLISAKEFMASHNQKFIAERLRTAYIGEDCFTEDGTQYIAMNRGKPTGTLVAVFDSEKKELVFGISLISDNEKYATPIVGLKRAYERALTGNNAIFGLDGHERKQFERFKLRAMAYFMPEKYSHSRGTDPVSYPNYEKIHARQVMIKGGAGK